MAGGHGYLDPPSSSEDEKGELRGRFRATPLFYLAFRFFPLYNQKIKIKEERTKAKDALYQLSISREYKEFLDLRESIREIPKKTDEGKEALDATALKVFQKFVAMVNPTISCTKGCTKRYGNETLSRKIFSERVEEYREAILKHCPEILPDFSDFMVWYLEFRFPNLWRPKTKKRRKK
jgi:hypothetical protein